MVNIAQAKYLKLKLDNAWSKERGCAFNHGEGVMRKGINSKKKNVSTKPARGAARMARAPAIRKKNIAVEPTRVIVKYDVGFNNHLSIRGQGGGLSWERGIALRNVAADEWVWESTEPCEECEFKVLINDEAYEVGENHKIYHGGIVQYTPQF
jgi:hypothetical protein